MLTLEDVAKDVTEIKVALKGYNGDLGLIPAFEKHCENDVKFRTEFYRFRRWAICLVSFLIGSGVISIGAIKAAQVITGG